jgi:hypothetical protein
MKAAGNRRAAGSPVYAYLAGPQGNRVNEYVTNG